MTICICSTIPLSSPNGAATFNKHFLELFCKRHQVIFLLVDTTASAAEKDITEYKNNYTSVILKQSYYQQLKKYKGYFRSGGSAAPKWIAAGLAFRNWLLKNNATYAIDIIEISDGSGMGIFLMDNKLPPVILTAHGSNLQISRFDHTAFDEHGKVIKKLEQLAYNNAAAIISHSPFNTEDLKLFTDKPIYTLPIPWSAAPVPLAAAAQNTSGLVIGALRYLKGPDLLCKALHNLQTDNVDIRINWIGNDTGSIKGHKNVSTYLQTTYPGTFQKSFIWKGALAQKEIIQEIKNAAYIIIPSVWETFNYVAIEAASLGKAIIISKTAGASYMFSNLINALVINSNNEEELAKAIIQLHTDKALKAYLGKNAQEMIANYLQPDDIINKRIEVYKKVINERKPYKISVEENVAFLEKYLNKRRRIYFFIRAILKGYSKLK